MLNVQDNSDLMQLLVELVSIKESLAERAISAEQTILDEISNSCEEALSLFCQYDVESLTKQMKFQHEDVYALNEVF